MKKRKPRDSSKTRIKNSLKKFKKAVEIQLGKINWGKVGIFALALLLMVALKGLLGPEAQLIAHGLMQLAAYA